MTHNMAGPGEEDEINVQLTLSVFRDQRAAPLNAEIILVVTVQR